MLAAENWGGPTWGMKQGKYRKEEINENTFRETMEGLEGNIQHPAERFWQKGLIFNNAPKYPGLK